MLKVLFLDDEADLCEIFSELLSGPNCEVRTFQDAGTALAGCESWSPDIAFLDFRLPGSSGLAVAAKLPKNTVKFLVTGELDLKPDPSVNGVLKKPLDFDQIVKIVDEAKRS